MNAEKQRILEMLQEGKINAAEATQLLDALESKPSGGSSSGGKEKRKLRVKVDGKAEGNKIKVDVAVPLALGKMIDGILENSIPTVARDAMNEQGFDISNIRIGELLEAMGDSDEDMVNVAIENDDDDIDMKVRVHVE